MPFEVIPAIDLVGGRLGRIRGGRPEPVEAFGGDPVAAATAFAEAGVRWIHVVDTDLAFTGNARGLTAVREIAGLPLRVQASGGFRAEPEIDAVLEAGAARADRGRSERTRKGTSQGANRMGCLGVSQAVPDMSNGTDRCQAQPDLH